MLSAKKRTGQLLQEGNDERHREMASALRRVLQLHVDAMDILLLAMCLQAIMADLHLTPAAVGLLATSTMIGVALSAVIMGWFSDNYGRRTALQLSLVSFSIFTMAIALTTNYWEILALRFIAGLGWAAFGGSSRPISPKPGRSISGDALRLSP